jgi:hypothetical protein
MTYLKAMFWTGVSAFLTVFVPASLGWLGEVSSTGNLADPSILRTTAISAAAAAVAAVVTAGTVALRKQPWFPAEPPQYGSNTEPAHYDGNVDG